MKGCFRKVCKYLELCSKNGITFNPDKFVFRREELDFAGFTVGMDRYRPTKHLIEAIENFPVPTDLTGIRSWFGLVQQASYAFSKMKEMKGIFNHPCLECWDQKSHQL